MAAPVVKLLQTVFEDANQVHASDIHVEPQEKEVIVRNRIDGICHEKLRLPKKVGPALIARLKIMCNLDISERRLPQDGRIVFKKFTKKNIDIDLRVATGPMNHGEKVVMRILDKQKTTLPMPALGFSEAEVALRDTLLPMAALLTPNLPEAEVLALAPRAAPPLPGFDARP